MKTYSETDESNGFVFAFEIENSYVSVCTVAKILSVVPGISDVRVRRLFSSWDEIHVWFKFRNSNFVVWEPFGDNSRFWIGPEDKNDRIDIQTIRDAFDQYSPSVLASLFGDIVTLRILKKLFGRVE